MSIPHDLDITIEMLRLLSKAPGGRMHCNDVYDSLARFFPQLSHDEKTIPYQNSKSKWANVVQFARLHCVLMGFIYRPDEGVSRGYWKITEAGRGWLSKLK